MSSSTIRPPATSGPLRVQPTRRVRPTVALGAALVMAVCAAGFTALYLSAGAKTEMVVLARDVEAGEVLGERDVRVARISTDPGVSVIPASALRSKVLGRRAAVPLFAGELLSDRQLTDAQLPGAGQAVIAVEATRGQIPDGLRAGETVQVLAAQENPPPDAPVDSAAATLASSARVFSVRTVEDDADELIVSLLVSADEAPRIARAAVAETVILVRLPARSGG